MSTLEIGRRHENHADRPPGPADASTSSFDALGHRFAVASECPRTVAFVEEAFAVLAVPGPPDSWYQIRRHADLVDVIWRDSNLGVATTLGETLSLLRWHVQRSAIATADDDLVLRAGSVELDGRTLVITGDPGCGVSTLLAALVAEGGTYLSDDTLPVEMRSGKVRPFPQPILLDDNSLDLLPEVSPLRSGSDTTHGRRLVAMKPAQSAPGHAARDVSVVLFPERDDSGIAVLEPVEPDDAVVRLAEHAYNFPAHEQDAIEAIHSLLWDAEAYSVVGGDPHLAARAVMDTLTAECSAPSSRSGHRMCPGTRRPPV